MCGIAGYVGRKKISEAVIQQTLACMRRRGPDNQAVSEFKIDEQHYCYFLHSRLSIIDLDERANQPFHFRDKTIIFNGEIYNYLEVRDKLQKLGRQFDSVSDTEVLIQAFDEWGTGCLQYLDGMWAFALYDHTKKEIILARDPFGEKPLHIYQPEPGEFYFGSEIKFLATLSGKRFQPNKNHIIRFLVNGYKSLYKQPETFFVDINEIPKSSFMTIDRTGKYQQQKYWRPIFAHNDNLSFQEAVDQTRTLLINSVQSRLRSDMPIAFCMSGGIDSNTLISIAKRIFNYDVHGFTILNSDSRYAEQDMIDIGVSELGIKHSSYAISADNFIQNMQSLVAYHEAPILTISFYLDWMLQKSISDFGYRISINGAAGDELFSGYFDHQLMYFYDIRDDEKLLVESIHHWQESTAPFVRNPFLQKPQTFLTNPFMRKHIYLNCNKYESLLKQPWHEDFYEFYYRDGLLQNRMLNEIFHETIPIILHENDLNAMYFSIENRTPFLNRALFEFAHSIPTRFLIKDGKAKILVREAMRGIVPDAIIFNKRKVGYNAPIMDLLNVKQPQVKKYLLQDSPIWEILDKKPIAELIEQSYLPNSDSKFLFSFLSSKIFLENFTT